MIKKMYLVCIAISFFACKKKFQEIPLDKVADDWKVIANKTANNILGFCDNEKDFNEFKLRSSTKSFLHFQTGKYALTSYVYENVASRIELGNLYKEVV